MKHWISFDQEHPDEEGSYNYIAVICAAKEESHVNHFVTKKPFMAEMLVKKYRAAKWFPLPPE